jgi:hypothetical protein
MDLAIQIRGFRDFFTCKHRRILSETSETVATKYIHRSYVAFVSEHDNESTIWQDWQP